MLVEVESARGNRLTILELAPAAVPHARPDPRRPARRRPHTRDVLHDLLGLSEDEIDAEFARGAALSRRTCPRSSPFERSQNCRGPMIG